MVRPAVVTGNQGAKPPKKPFTVLGDHPMGLATLENLGEIKKVNVDAELSVGVLKGPVSITKKQANSRRDAELSVGTELSMGAKLSVGRSQTHAAATEKGKKGNESSLEPFLEIKWLLLQVLGIQLLLVR